jgi:hypothetical protein
LVGAVHESLEGVAVAQGRQSDADRGAWLAFGRLAARHGRNPAKSSVARKLLICSWHMLSRNQVFQPPPATASSSRFLAA